jgi:hypothetical protein
MEHEWNGSAGTDYPAVLQAGSGVLVDDRGIPRVRCTSGNPLEPPDDTLGDDLAGDAWRWFTPSAVATVTPAERPMNAFAVVDLDSGTMIQIPARH